MPALDALEHVCNFEKLTCIQAIPQNKPELLEVPGKCPEFKRFRCSHVLGSSSTAMSPFEHKVPEHVHDFQKLREVARNKQESLEVPDKWPNFERMQCTSSAEARPPLVEGWKCLAACMKAVMCENVSHKAAI